MINFVTMTLCATLIILTAACAEIKINESETFRILSFRNAEMICNPESEEPFEGWKNTEDPFVTDELRTVFERAAAGAPDENCVPVACLGARQTDGGGLCFLTQVPACDSEAAPKFVLEYIGRDPSGKITVRNTTELAVVPNENGEAELISQKGTQLGGWRFETEFAIDEAMRQRFDAALNSLLGATYEPIANLAAQTGKEVNRCFLCKVTPAVPNPVSRYALVYITENSEGGATLRGAIDLNYGAAFSKAA